MPSVLPELGDGPPWAPVPSYHSSPTEGLGTVRVLPPWSYSFQGRMGRWAQTEGKGAEGPVGTSSTHEINQEGVNIYNGLILS